MCNNALMEVELKYYGQLFPTTVVLATCIDREDKPNIITLGWAMKTSGKPPMVAISIAPTRHSYSLIEENDEFVLAIPTSEILEAVHRCGRVSGRTVNKFEKFNLTPLPAKFVKPPLIKECVANLECRVVGRITTGDHTIFVGEVLAAHVNDQYYEMERLCLNLDKAKVIVTHGDEYREIGRVIAYKLNGEVKRVE